MGRRRQVRLPPAQEDCRAGHVPGSGVQFPGAARQLEVLRLSYSGVSVFLAGHVPGGFFDRRIKN